LFVRGPACWFEDRVIRDRFVKIVLLCAVCSANACSNDSLRLDNNDLSSLLSITDVAKTVVQDDSNPELVAGLIVNTTVIHTGFVRINVPFRMTWQLRRDGTTVGAASRDFDSGFAPAQTERVRLVLSFPPVVSLDGVTDAVTFDFLDTTSLSIMGG
jgi:hypothetical protein